MEEENKQKNDSSKTTETLKRIESRLQEVDERIENISKKVKEVYNKKHEFQVEDNPEDKIRKRYDLGEEIIKKMKEIVIKVDEIIKENEILKKKYEKKFTTSLVS